MEFLVVSDQDPVTVSHEHVFTACKRLGEMTTLQINKLIFYRGPIDRCECGTIRIVGKYSHAMYSRNGSRV